jgi:Hemerythrin HHE cation binding domain
MNARCRICCMRGATGAVIALLAALLPSTVKAQERHGTADFPIPMTLVEEHAEFRTTLEGAARVSGPLGDAANDVLALIDPHMAKEQRYALAALRLLPALARGQVTPDMEEWLCTADALRSELDTLSREHRSIAQALNRLSQTAWAEGHPQYVFLAARVLRHARMEEEILYPAALVVGDYVRLRLAALRTSAITSP